MILSSGKEIVAYICSVSIKLCKREVVNSNLLHAQERRGIHSGNTPL